jgi:hypothetical protein
MYVATSAEKNYNMRLLPFIPVMSRSQTWFMCFSAPLSAQLAALYTLAP